MSRVIAVMACGFTLAACSSSLPSLDFLKGSPATEVLRIESEPPGADARTSQGQTCRTPCEITVPSSGELTVTVAINGYQPQTVPVRAELPEGVREGEGAARLQPNPVYVELQRAAPARPVAKKAAPAKKKKVTARPAPTPQATEPANASSPYPPGYPWPNPQ